MGTLSFLGLGTDLGVLIVSAVLFSASRDALAKYYSRTGRLLGQVAEKKNGENSMFNGNDHGTTSDPISSPANPKSKAQAKPTTPAKPNREEKKDASVRK
jgi:hypothetical protein